MKPTIENLTNILAELPADDLDTLLEAVEAQKASIAAEKAEVHKGKKHDKRHGGPYDRGSADSYYRRPRNPHYYLKGTGMSPCVGEDKMTPAEVEAYDAGFDENEADRNFKY